MIRATRKVQSKRRPRQLAMELPTWGGRRKGAGRKRCDGRTEKGASHLRRAAIDARLPLHVTLRVDTHVYNLRSERAWRHIAPALEAGADRFGVRVVQFSVQGNHIHCLVEAADAASLARAMKGLSVRLARRMNVLMGRRGRVMSERYHARALRTPTEVRNAMHYIRHNRRHHLGAEALPGTWVDPRSSEAGVLALPAAVTWLLRVGWTRARGPDALLKT